MFKQQPQQGDIWKDFQADVRRVWDPRPQGSCEDAPSDGKVVKSIIKAAIAYAVQRNDFTEVPPVRVQLSH